NLDDFILGKYRRRVASSSPAFLQSHFSSCVVSMSIPFFPHHVGGVIGWRTNEKVRRIATGRIVTAMKNAEFGGIDAEGKKISQSVSTVLLASHMKQPVPFFVFMPRPRPTSDGIACHLRPEKCDSFFAGLRNTTMCGSHYSRSPGT